MDKKLLESRNALKAKKPHFVRQESPKRVRLKTTWRKPKGMHSKQREGWVGHKASVQVGWGSPAEVKGLTKDGIRVVTVNNKWDLMKIKEGEAALVSRSVGQRKRVEIAKKADELGIKIMNIKDAKEYVKSVNEKIQKHKEEKQKHIKEKEKKKEETKKKTVKKKEDLAEKLTDEEKKEIDKKEREKLLTKKEN